MTKLKLFALSIAFLTMSTAAAVADRSEVRSDLPPPAADHANPLDSMREKYPEVVAELEKIIASNVLERNGGSAAIDEATGALEIAVYDASDVSRVSNLSDIATISVREAPKYQDGTRNQDTDQPYGHFGGANMWTGTPDPNPGFNCTSGVPLKHTSGFMAITTAGHCLYGLESVGGDWSGLEWWYSGSEFYGAGGQFDYNPNGDIGRITSGNETYGAEVWHGNAFTSLSYPVVGWTFVNQSYDDICVSTRFQGSLCGWEVRHGYTWRCNSSNVPLPGCAWTVQLNEPSDGWTVGGDSGSPYYRLVAIAWPPYTGVEIVGSHQGLQNNWLGNPRYIFGTTPDVIESTWPGWSIATSGPANTSW